MTREPEETLEEIDFDVRAEPDPDDLVEIDVGGVAVPCVLVAVVEDEDSVYAVLQPREGDDPDLLLARFDESADGASRFSPVDDPEVVERVLTLLLRILPVDDPDGVDVGTDGA